MNKAQLIELITKNLNAVYEKDEYVKYTNKVEAGQILTGVSNAIREALAIDGEVTLPGLGKFKTVERPTRTGRNPQTGEPVQIAASIAVKFQSAKQLKDFLNT